LRVGAGELGPKEGIILFSFVRLRVCCRPFQALYRRGIVRVGPSRSCAPRNFRCLDDRQHDAAALLCAFDLIELDGRDLRPASLEERKHVLANALYRERDSIIFNQSYDGDGAIIFKQACAMGCEGIVSKRLGYPYPAASITGSRSRTRPRRR
jgi:ATP dependent DNA ligase domain